MSGPPDRSRLRRAVLVVAALNLAYFVVEGSVALAIGSVSLAADSADFLEDTAISLLVVVALGWSPRRQVLVGRAMAAVVLLPALAAGWLAFAKASDPVAPDVLPLVLTAGGAAAVNLVCALALARFRHHGSAMARAAFLSARNDVAVNVAIIAMGVVTALTRSGWPDLVLGLLVVALGVAAAKEVWETAHEEHLAATALTTP